MSTKINPDVSRVIPPKKTLGFLGPRATTNYLTGSESDQAVTTAAFTAGVDACFSAGFFLAI
jgi:hypothetical protein